MQAAAWMWVSTWVRGEERREREGRASVGVMTVQGHKGELKRQAPSNLSDTAVTLIDCQLQSSSDPDRIFLLSFFG